MYGLGYHNVTAAIFQGMRHEILNEIDRKTVWDDILQFIRESL
jgi:alpha-beta hydrolase superfamily lysophospholipase